MAVGYKFQGVPRTFKTKEQALSFLRSSPGYVSRQSDYLKTYWPGLMSQIQPKKTGGGRAGTTVTGGKATGSNPISAVADEIVKGIRQDLGVVRKADNVLGLSKAAKQIDEVQSKVTGIHAKTALKTYADPLRPDYWKQLGGSGKSLLNPGQAAERDTFADSVMMFHGIGGAGLGLAKRPAGIKNPAKVATSVASRRAGQTALSSGKRLATEEAGTLGPRGVLRPTPDTPIAPLEPSPVVVPDALAQARAGLKGAASVHAKQAAGYGPERAARAAAASEAMKKGGVAGHRAALAELRGELPKIRFDGFKDVSEQDFTTLLDHIGGNPHLGLYQKVKGQKALIDAVENGRVPAPHERLILEKAFGKETADHIATSIKGGVFGKLQRVGLEAWNLPRSLMASFDMSAPFRQGLVIGTRHPVIFAKNFAPMVKSFGSDKVWQGVMDDIVSRPTFGMMQHGGLALTDLGKIGTREEAFPSQFADHIPGIKGSGRAYTAFLNKTRADVFDHLLVRAEQQGRNVASDDKLLRDLSIYINAATGRGQLPKAIAPAANALNSVFFSPRLMFSRFNFLNPQFYNRMDPFARKEALRAALQTVGTLGTVLSLGAAAGAKVVTDPRNPDFAKARFGNTRIDFAAGFQQPVRLISQLASGTAISSTSGKKLKLTEGGFGDPTRLDLGIRFFRGKLAPSPSLIADKLAGSNMIGTPFDLKDEATQRMIPLLMQDSHELYKDRQGGVDGITAALLGYSIGMWGIGAQTYAAKPAKKSKSNSIRGEGRGSVRGSGRGSVRP